MSTSTDQTTDHLDEPTTGEHHGHPGCTNTEPHDYTPFCSGSGCGSRPPGDEPTTEPHPAIETSPAAR